MATVTARAIIWNTTAGNKATGSFTPASGDLLVAIVGIATLDTAPTMADSQSGAWTLVDTFRSQAATGGLRMYVRNTAAPNTSMTVSYTSSGDAGGGIAVLSVTDVSVFGAGAVRSSGGQADQASGTPAPVLNQTPRSTNAIISAVMDNTNGTANAVPRVGYSEHYDQGFTTPATGIEVNSLGSGETSATITYNGTTPSTFASIAIEINSPVVKTGISESPRTASGADAATLSRIGAAIAVQTASGAKQLTVQRSGSASVVLEAIGSEVLTATKLGAGVSARVASGASVKSTSYPRSGDAQRPHVASGGDVATHAETGISQSRLFAVGGYAATADMTGGATLVTASSGAFVREIVKAGSVDLTMEAVASEVMERAKEGAAELDLVASGEQERFQQKSGLGEATLVGTGERGQIVYNREGTGTLDARGRGRSTHRPLADRVAAAGTSLGSSSVAGTE